MGLHQFINTHTQTQSLPLYSRECTVDIWRPCGFTVHLTGTKPPSTVTHTAESDTTASVSGSTAGPWQRSHLVPQLVQPVGPGSPGWSLVTARVPSGPTAGRGRGTSLGYSVQAVYLSDVTRQTPVTSRLQLDRGFVLGLHRTLPAYLAVSQSPCLPVYRLTRAAGGRRRGAMAPEEGHSGTGRHLC